MPTQETVEQDNERTLFFQRAYTPRAAYEANICLGASFDSRDYAFRVRYALH
jgi:hypothetical protein